MSGNLSCNAKNCTYNIYGMCTSNNIHIQGTNAHSKEFTKCGSFTEKGLKNIRSNVYNPNIYGTVENKFTCSPMEQSVRCDASNCKHNINGDCTSQNVSVNGPGALSNNRTDCESFMI